ncbi:putative bifunctional diguanylate cyclase/phosphodiesterase [Marinobacterium aestuariivivens]|uniref:Bifunctional diguanylate cyclase/phosphodiesterase n=1 Tax=Marinobacterium aestuariivivens TaxID=1698799 RepID=A0ABW2A699_9GAMM
MYKAKEDGKNIYRYYSQQLTRRAMEHVSLASELHRALTHDEFLVHYQTQFDLQTRAFIGMEALVRWQHPTQGLLLPGRFLPIAEGSGLIARIGNCVMEMVMQQTRRWHEAGLDPGVVAINLSSRQIDSERQLELIRDGLDRHGCKPEWFELEVTEDFLMQNPERAIELFHRLRDLGFELAIDDFGTGFSSLSYLKRLPLTRLKIDRAFVRDLPGDADDQAISCAVIALGQNLGLKVIAEGVETQEQADFLRAAGCDEVQGFLFSRPQPAHAITETLRTRKQHIAAANAGS